MQALKEKLTELYVNVKDWFYSLTPNHKLIASFVGGIILGGLLF